MSTRTCPSCGARDYGTPFCVSCQKPFPRAEGAIFEPGAPVTAPTTEVVPAGFFRRFAAIMIDWVVLSIIGDVVSYAYKLGRAGEGGMMSLNTAIGFSTLLFFVYFTLLTSEGGQTLGKMVLGIRVVRADGKPIGYGRAFARTFGYIVSSFFFCLGYLWAIWDPKKQAWHDKIAGTVVIRV